MFKNALSLFIVSIVSLAVTAQMNIGVVTKSAPSEVVTGEDIPVNKWVGLKFYFIYLDIALQKYGYGHDIGNTPGFQRSSLDYKKYAGKTVTILEIEEDEYVKVFFTAKMKVDETGEILFAKIISGGFSELAPFAEIELAKKRWLGKTIYSGRETNYILTFNAQTSEAGKVTIKHYESLKVVAVAEAVMAGFDSGKTPSCSLIVETSSGVQGALRVPYSWTNHDPLNWNDRRPWQELLLEENPREKYKWTPEMWEAIETGKTRLGMTAEQVKFSWGEPEKINKTISGEVNSEQWIYDDQYLYFENGKLTAMQTPSK